MKWWWCCLLLVQQCVGQEDAGSLQKTPSSYHGVMGNRYFIADWSDGVVHFTNGRVMKQFKLKFDCLQNQLMLQFEGSTFAAESRVKEFVLFSKNHKDSFVFRKGFPPAGKANSETFYQVLVEGKVILLKQIVKIIIEEKQIIEPNVHRRLEEEVNFYVLREGDMHKVNSEKNALSEILSDRSDQLKDYIATNQLKMRSAEDLIRVVKWYNESATVQK